VFHCEYGKDRTGVIAALILGCLGLDDELIIEDYAISETLMTEEVKAIGAKEANKYRINPEIWLATPEESMRKTLSFIRERYGSVSAYLTLCGFDDSLQQKLKDALLSP